MQAVLDAVDQGFPGCSDDVFAYTDGVPRPRTVAGFDVDASLRGRCVFAVEDADFEINQVKGFDYRIVRTQRLSKRKVESVCRADTTARGVLFFFTDLETYPNSFSGWPTELIHTW